MRNTRLTLKAFTFKQVLPESPRSWYPNKVNHKMLLEMKSIKKYLQWANGPNEYRVDRKNGMF